MAELAQMREEEEEESKGMLRSKGVLREVSEPLMGVL